MLRLACKRLPPARPHLYAPLRTLVTPRTAVSSPHWTRAGLVVGGVLTTSLVLGNILHADAPDEGANKAAARPQPSLSSLVRSYVVYSMCSIPAVIDWAPTVLSACTSVPGLKQVTEAIVRHTFFNQVRYRLYPVWTVDRVMSVCRRGHGRGLSSPIGGATCGRQGEPVRIQRRGRRGRSSWQRQGARGSSQADRQA